MRSQNHQEINKAYRRFSGYLIICVAIGYPENIEAIIEYEPFDVELYKDQINPLYNRILYEYTREDGTEVYVTYDEYLGAQITDTPPMPCFDKVFRRFNADGLLLADTVYKCNMYGVSEELWVRKTEG